MAPKPASKKEKAAPIEKIPEAPPHDYIQHPQIFLPLRKLMPDESGITYSPIHPIFQLRHVLGLIFYLAIAGAIVFLALVFLKLAPAWLMFGAALSLMLPTLIAGIIEAAYAISLFRFSLQQEYLFVRAGAIDPTYHLIPYENIQDAQVRQGIVQRMLGISDVVVSTPACAVLIPDIGLGDARKFRDELLTLSRLHRGMAE